MSYEAAFRNSKKDSLLKRAKKQKFYLIGLIPFLAYLLVFKYYPMYGAIIAFKDFSFSKGIIGSQWAGLKYFKMFLNSPDLPVVMRNTLTMSSLSLIFVTTCSILLAIVINEIRSTAYKRIVQTVSYLPHFISWIVVIGMFKTLFSIDSGPVNNILIKIGLIKMPINFLGDPDKVWGIVTSLNVWKSIGWNSIIYIAAITSIETSMYESAIIDGASKFKQILHITLPSIMPTITILFIFSLGYILNAGFEQQLFLQNPVNYKYAEVLDTYVFKYGLQKSMYSYGAAVGLMKSAIGFALILIVNKFTRKVFKMGVF